MVGKWQIHKQSACMWYVTFQTFMQTHVYTSHWGHSCSDHIGPWWRLCTRSFTLPWHTHGATIDLGCDDLSCICWGKFFCPNIPAEGIHNVNTWRVRGISHACCICKDRHTGNLGGIKVRYSPFGVRRCCVEVMLSLGWKMMKVSRPPPPTPCTLCTSRNVWLKRATRQTSISTSKRFIR